MRTQFKVEKTSKQMLPASEFNPSIQVEATGERLSCEVGVIGLRELDDRLGLTSDLADKLFDMRDPKRVIHPMRELFRTRMYGIAQGWGDVDDCDKLRHDYAFRLGVSERKGDAPLRKSEELEECGPDGLSSQPTQSRLTAALSDNCNRSVLKEALLDWSLKALDLSPMKNCDELTADIDSSMHEVFGLQAGATFNGHYHCNGYKSHYVYLPEARTWLGGVLGIGSEYSSTGAEELLLPILDELHKRTNIWAHVRGDVAYAIDELMNALETHKDRDGGSAPISYCFRLKANTVLQQLAEPFLVRPEGRPPKKPRNWFHELKYKADKWSRTRRVVLVVREVPNELFLESFFLITNFSSANKTGEQLCTFYRKRGIMEADIGQLKSTVVPNLSSADRTPVRTQEARTKEEQFEADQKTAFSNEATLLMNLLAYNFLVMVCHLMNQACPKMDEAQSGHQHDPFRRRKAKKKQHYGWSVKRIREQVLKCAGRFVLGGKKVRVIISYQASELWQRFWQAITALPVVVE